MIFNPPKEHVMNVDKAVLMFAGCVVLLGLGLGYLVSPYWYLLTAFAGLNMFQASITGFCPAAIVFRKLGLRSGNAFS
jgi:hypothetical protein